MTYQKEYRWGILGPGRIAHQFAKALKVTGRGKLWAVGSRDIIRAQDFANGYEAPFSYASYDELIRDPAVDVIYIATPHHLHYNLSKKCILAGKPVLCEKPITINTAQFQELRKLAVENKVFYMDALWTRFLPTITKTEELIQKIGPVISLRADFGFKANYEPRSRLFNPELGGGSLLDIGIYPIFLAMHLLGEPSRILSTMKMAPSGTDETMAALLMYESGAIARVFSTFMANTKTEAEIACKNGMIIIHGRFHSPSFVEMKINGQEPREFHFDYRANGYEYEAEEVMQCLDQNLLESPRLPHSFTESLMKTMDIIRDQNELVYPMEKT